MKYHNPKIPEGINVTDEHPLKGFLYLLATVVGVVALAAIVLSLSVGVLVKFIPFETEASLAESIVTGIEKKSLDDENIGKSSYEQRVTEYLQQLADQLSVAQKLPEEMKITVHYVNEPVVNAFATLGGHIVIYQGIIDVVESENALAMVIAHEIAHIKHRHPIVAMGRGVSIAFLLTAVTGLGDGSLANDIVGQTSLFTSLAFSRHQETESDVEAYNALLNYYGHGRGATDLFAVLKKQSTGFAPPELLSSHPLSEKRIKKIESLETQATSQCADAVDPCELTLLPAFIK